MAISQPVLQCDDSEDEVNLSRCIANYVENQLNCTSHILMSSQAYQSCGTNDYGMLSELLYELATMSEKEIFKTTGKFWHKIAFLTTRFKF